MSKKSSYPSFLWITWCKILFIVDDNMGKPGFVPSARAASAAKKA
ncbi:hypothetical protein [Paramixta manurensis]